MLYAISDCPDYLNVVFCPVDDNGVATHTYIKKLKLPFRKSKLGMPSLSYVGFSTCHKLPNTLKIAFRVKYFKHDIKKYLLKILRVGA